MTVQCMFQLFSRRWVPLKVWKSSAYKHWENAKESLNARPGCIESPARMIKQLRPVLSTLLQSWLCVPLNHDYGRRLKNQPKTSKWYQFGGWPPTLIIGSILPFAGCYLHPSVRKDRHPFVKGSNAPSHRLVHVGSLLHKLGVSCSDRIHCILPPASRLLGTTSGKGNWERAGSSTTCVFRVVLQKQYVLSVPWLGRKWVWLGWRRGRWFLSPWAPNLGPRSFPTVTSAHGRLHVIQDINGRFFCWRWSWKLEDFFLVILPSFFILFSFSHFSHLFLFLSPPWISFSIQAGRGWWGGWKWTNWTNWTTSTDQGWFRSWTGRVPCHSIYEGFKGHVEVDISRSHAMAQTAISLIEYSIIPITSNNSKGKCSM